MSKGKLTPNTMMSASRLPGLLGHSKHWTPNEELLLSIGALKGEENPYEVNEAADWGNTLEPKILERSAERLGLDTYNLEHTEALFAKNLPLCCSLDGTADGKGKTIRTDPDAGIFVVGQDEIVLEGEGVLEAKLTSYDAEDTLPLWRGPIQVQGQMMCTGAKWGAVCVLYRGTKLRIFVFAPHKGTQDAIRAAVLDFNRRLDVFKISGEIEYYPPATSNDANVIWPSGDDETVVLEPDAEQIAAEIADARKKISELQEFIEIKETQIKSMMTTHTKAVAGKYRITWPMRSYKAQPERIVPAKDAYVVRQSSITVREMQ